jgi:hypothetical protein
VLKITRFIRVGTVTLRGKEVGFTRLYVEAWTPFLRGADDFNAVATLLGPGGEPSAVLHAGKDFPHYPNLDAQTTSGYAVAFNARRPAERDAVGVVFGGKPAEPREAGNISLFNLMQWDDGIGVLPGVVFGSAEAGSVVEQSIYLVPRPGLHAEMRETVTALAAGAAAPRLWRPAELAGGELREIAARLEDNVDRPGTRTEHLRASIRKD